MTKSSPAKIRDLPFHQQLEKANPDLDLTPELKRKIDKLIQSLDEKGIDYGKFKPQKYPYPEKKKGYPNYDQYMHIPSQHDAQKWLQAVQNLYKMEQTGHNRVQSIRQVTAGWNLMETYDFLHWLRYYEEGAHLKYKTAQLWYENGAPGYFLHVKPDPPKEPEPVVSGKDVDFARQQAVDDDEKRQTIEKQRNKIIGRLDSAEKLLRSHDGQVFAGPELEALMEAIYQLKKRIQLVNKLSTSTRLYEDLIVRQANVLQREGFVKAASWLHSQAQANNPPPSDREIGVAGPINQVPPPEGPELPAAPLHPGAPGGLPSYGPGMSQNAPAGTGVPEVGPNENSPTNLQGVAKSPPETAGNGVPTPMPQEETHPAGIAEFIDRMNDGKETEQDDLEINDVIDVSDIDDEMLVTEAQMTPPVIDEPITTDPTPARGTPAPAPKDLPKEPKVGPREPALEVTEDDIPPAGGQDKPEADITGFTDKVNSIFSGVTVADAVALLEDLAKIFKVREVPRQLAIVDMMLNALDLSSVFPSLSEAQAKALESNNYISTRVEDVLSKLRGSMESNQIDLRGGGKTNNPEASKIKDKLTQDAEKEKQRKQQRKEQADAELAGAAKETPEVEIEEDLGPKPAVPARPPVPRPVG
jgi:hypothetical protein